MCINDLQRRPTPRLSSVVLKRLVQKRGLSPDPTSSFERIYPTHTSHVCGRLHQKPRPCSGTSVAQRCSHFMVHPDPPGTTRQISPAPSILSPRRTNEPAAGPRHGQGCADHCDLESTLEPHRLFEPCRPRHPSSSEANDEGGIGFAGFHDLIVPIQEGEQSGWAVRSDELTAFVNVRGQKLSDVEQVHPSRQSSVF